MAREDVHHRLRGAGLHQCRGQCAGAVGPARVADHSALSQRRSTTGVASIRSASPTFARGRILGGENGTPGLLEEEASEPYEDGTVTEVVTAYVKPDKIGEYTEWAAKIHKVEAQFPGYRGGFLQPPTSASQSYWTTLVRFATPEQLDAWLSSSERQKLLCEHDALVSSWSHHRMPSSFAAWFPADQTGGASPPAWKQSMIVVLMLFPIVMAEIRFLSPWTHGLNPSLATFIGNVISVVLLAWPFMPLAIAL
jgi:uncharacterized protein